MDNQASLFYRHVASFLEEHRAGPPSALAIGVSGGVDSMLLMYWAQWYTRRVGTPRPRVFFIHHHTRPEQDFEQQLVAAHARKLGLEFQALHLEGQQSHNREAFWRGERRRLFFAALRPSEELWLGHHLDDSWEWAQLSAARSSEVRSGLGIPLRADRLWHPFLCVSKAQIYREARRRALEWCEDPSNLSSQQARSFWRGEIAPLVKSQHPQYLKHYARRSQRLAETLGLALRRVALAPSSRSAQGELFWSPPSRAQLLSSIQRLSQAERGCLTREVEKILRAQKRGKHGPFRLAGGVRVALQGEWLVVMGAGFELQEMLPSSLEFRAFTRAQFVQLLHLSAAQALGHLPFWCALESGRVRPAYDGLRGTHLSTSIPVVNAQKLLKQWRDPQRILRLSPLWPLPSASPRD